MRAALKLRLPMIRPLLMMAKLSLYTSSVGIELTGSQIIKGCMCCDVLTAGIVSVANACIAVVQAQVAASRTVIRYFACMVNTD